MWVPFHRFFIIFVHLSIFALFVYPEDANATKIEASSFLVEHKDMTRAIIKALSSEYDTIIIDDIDEKWVVGPILLRGIKNKSLLFEKGVGLYAEQGSYQSTSASLLKFINCTNLHIIGNGSTLFMNKEEYVDGEWRMGLSILKCKNIFIRNLRIEGSGGDGIYIDGKEEGTFSENIFIDKVLCINNKRQGASIISAKNVWITNSVFSHTSGTLPGSGIDIEPDSASDILVNINFEDCYFSHNDHSGVLIALHKLKDYSEPISIRFTNCYLTNNHNEQNVYESSEIVIKCDADACVDGKILFEDIYIENSQWGVLYSNKPSNGFEVVFKDLTARQICTKGTKPPFYFEVTHYFKSSPAIGGFTFTNCYLEYDNDQYAMIVHGSSLRTLSGFENVTGDITVKNPFKNLIKYEKYSPSDNREVDINFLFAHD